MRKQTEREKCHGRHLESSARFTLCHSHTELPQVEGKQEGEWSGILSVEEELENPKDTLVPCLEHFLGATEAAKAHPCPFRISPHHKDL